MNPSRIAFLSPFIPSTPSFASPRMTLRPQDTSDLPPRDRQAIESEFIMHARISGAVDNSMSVLRERMQMLVRKERAWKLSEDWGGLSVLTGVPGEPSLRAWVLLGVLATVPLYFVCVLMQGIVQLQQMGG